MSDADRAYAAAERMIAELGEATRLNFGRDETRALTRLPDEIAGLTGLQWLSLDNTGVTDAGLAALGGLTGLQRLYLANTGVTDAGLEALRGLTGLQSLSLANTGVTDAGLAALRGLPGLRTLWLNNTGVRDLRALKDMSSLVEGAKVWGGLRFAGTPATRLDPELKRLSEIGNDEERTRATLDYLRGLGEDWPPVPEGADLPEVQSLRGLVLGTDAQGRIAYDWGAIGPALPGLVPQFHEILSDELRDFLQICPAGHNIYGLLGGKLVRYQTALTKEPETLIPALVWKYGNDLRILLRGNRDRMANQIDGMPRLDVPFHAKLEALVASHNILCDAHPVLSALDLAATDPAERQRAEANRQLMAEMLGLLEAQVHLIVDDLRRDFRDLHLEAQGETPAAVRALVIEDETLRNVIRLAVAEAVAESKGKGRYLGRLAADAHNVAVGVVAVGVAQAVVPAMTPAYMALVAQLQPMIGAYLASWPTPPESMRQVVDYLMVRWKARGD